jgi:hypothetical protein
MERYRKLIWTVLVAIGALLGNLALANNTGNDGITLNEALMAASVFLGPFVTLVAPANALTMEQLKQQAQDNGLFLSKISNSQRVS